MFEILLVIGGLFGLTIIGILTIVVTPEFMVEFGFSVLAVGLLIGLPTGCWYHVVLYRELTGGGPLPSRWWRSPVEWHGRLAPAAFRRVQPWFIGGAVGFVLCCVGGGAAIAGLSILQYLSTR